MNNDLANSSSKAFPFGDVRELPSWMFFSVFFVINLVNVTKYDFLPYHNSRRPEAKRIIHFLAAMRVQIFLPIWRTLESMMSI